MLLEEIEDSKQKTTIKTICLVQNSLFIMVSKYL